MKPMIILPHDAMSDNNIKHLRDNGICVVVAADPAKVKFVDPIPCVSSRTQIENAAIRLSRILLNGQWGNITSSGALDRRDIARIYIDCLIEGTPLDRNGSIEEQESKYFNQVKMDEISRMAREEARAERAAKKAAKKIEDKK